MEILGFKVNPVTGKLEKTVAIEYYWISGLKRWNDSMQ